MKARTLIGCAAAASLVGALACIGIFVAIGSKVAPDGTLVEPFFLIPIGWLLLAVAAALGVAYLVMVLVARRDDARSR